MTKRKAREKVEKALARQAAVVLVGPRQLGKTTLALDVADERSSQYLDLESASQLLTACNSLSLGYFEARFCVAVKKAHA